MFGFFRNNSKDMILLAGLGNQGKKYENNRHNIGFMVVDEMANSFSAGPFKDKYFGKFVSHNFCGRKVGLIKTGQYMNEGGKSVAAVASFFKIPPDKIIVFHDDLDLSPGVVKAKKGGGHAGHNGLKSVDACLGTNEYWRVRLGIGHPRDLDPSGNCQAAKDEVSSYVLSDFNKDDKKWLEALLQDIGRYSDLLAECKVEEFVQNIKR